MRCKIVPRNEGGASLARITQKLRHAGPINGPWMVVINPVAAACRELTAVQVEVIQRNTRAVLPEALLDSLSQPAFAGAAAAYDCDENPRFVHTTAFSRVSAITS